MVNFFTTGSWSRTERFLAKIQRGQLFNQLERFGQTGVDALAAATPSESGLTAASWSYRTEISASQAKIVWTNSNIHEGVPIAIILQFGHGTGTGGYVQGRDYINPAMQPIFDQLADSVWKAVTSA